MHTCENCDKEFKRKRDFENHVNKEKCARIKYDLNCPFCDKLFTTHGTVTTHIKKFCKFAKHAYDTKIIQTNEQECETECISKSNNKIIQIKEEECKSECIRKLNNKIIQLKKENEELKNKIIYLEKHQQLENIQKIKKPKSGSIKLNNYVRNKDMDIAISVFENDTSPAIYNGEHMTTYKKNMLTVLNCTDNEIVKLTELIYLNESYPQNHNMCITDNKHGVIHIYKDNKWESDTKIIFLKHLCTKMASYINNKLSTFKDLLKCDIYERLNLFFEKNYNFKDIRINVCKLGLLFYDKRKMFDKKKIYQQSNG